MATTFTTYGHREQWRPQPLVSDGALQKTGKSTGEISRLLCAAVVSKSFRELLLDQPKEALDGGFDGKAFTLTSEERKAVLAIDAVTLDEFAVRLIESLEQPSQPQIKAPQSTQVDQQEQYTIPLVLMQGAD